MLFSYIFKLRLVNIYCILDIMLVVGKIMVKKYKRKFWFYVDYLNNKYELFIKIIMELKILYKYFKEDFFVDGRELKGKREESILVIGNV